MIHQKQLMLQIEKIIGGNYLSVEDYMYLTEVCMDLDNSWIFIVSNMIVVSSMKNNYEQTLKMLRQVLLSLNNDIKVQQLDFYLSSAFWSLYINMPYNREIFVDIFRNTVELYEAVLFDFPINKRHSTMRKFTEEFDLIFEDGFNPIAFYFYTAPSESLLYEDIDWDGGKKQLKIYWELSERLNESGNYGQMLRIVHALGQMISIYPKEGYEALKNIAPYKHSIVKKGIIRILKENYVRYNAECKIRMN